MRETLDVASLQIEQRDPRQLKPHPKNSRFHPEVQLKQLAASLRRFGITKPILIDDDDTILAGHATTLAAIECKLPSVPVVVAHDWSDEQKRAYLIAQSVCSQSGESVHIKQND